MAPKHRHILKLCSDEHSPFVCGYTGDPWVRTPNLDRLAANGVVFQNCYAANPVCVPGRYSMVAGKLPRELGTPYFSSRLPLETHTYMRHFAQHGYQTTCVGKMHFQGPEQMHGWLFRPYGDMQVYNHQKVKGYTKHKDVTGGDPKKKVSPGDHGGPLPFQIKRARPGTDGFMLFDESVTREAVLHLKDYFSVLIHTRYQGERPLLFEVSWKTPHWPFICPPDLYDYYRDLVELPKLPQPKQMNKYLQRKQERDNSPDMTDEHRLNARAAYWGLVQYTDAQVGIVLQALEELGMMDDFNIMYCSDHGETAGERGFWGKSVFYEESVKVPMILAGPDLPKGKSVKENVSLCDLFPTLCDLADLPRPEGIRGQSMIPLIDNDCFGQRTVFSELYGRGGDGTQQNNFMVKQGHFKYCDYCDGFTQLFDLEKDAQELRNITDDPAYAKEKKELAQALKDLPEPWNADAPDWKMESRPE